MNGIACGGQYELRDALALYVLVRVVTDRDSFLGPRRLDPITSALPTTELPSAGSLPEVLARALTSGGNTIWSPDEYLRLLRLLTKGHLLLGDLQDSMAEDADSQSLPLLPEVTTIWLVEEMLLGAH